MRRSSDVSCVDLPSSSFRDVTEKDPVTIFSIHLMHLDRLSVKVPRAENSIIFMQYSVDAT